MAMASSRASMESSPSPSTNSMPSVSMSSGATSSSISASTMSFLISASKVSFMTATPKGSRRGHLPQHVLEDTTVLEVLHLLRRIEAGDDVERLPRAGLHRQALAGAQPVRDAADGEHLLAREAEALPPLPWEELERKHAHADEVRAVDALVALGDDGLDPQEVGPLGGPVTGRAGPVLLAGDH